MAESDRIAEPQRNSILLIRYPQLTEDGKLDTLQFLEASRSVIRIYDSLGSGLLVVKKDMLGNVEKLTAVYNKSPAKYRYLNDLIFHEKEDSGLYAVDALLWLKRALEFTVCFVKKMVEDWKNEVTSESVTHIVEEAYNTILKKHHNWLVQNLFKVLIRTFPYRASILSAIRTCYTGEEYSLDESMEITSEFFAELEMNLLTIINIYRTLGLQIEDNISVS